MVYWLHGGLHIYRNAQGRTRKIVNNGRSILGSLPNGRIPTFISEGTSVQKSSSIQRSAYLSQGLTALRSNTDNLVMFGMSLAPNDRHILDLILKSRSRSIAFSIYPSSRFDVALKRAEVSKLFAGMNVRFFDSTTHPLGDPSLRVL